MGITAVCDACGKKYQAADRMAGKRIKCRNCGAAIQLPGGTDGTSPDDTASGGDAKWELGTAFGTEESSGEAPAMEANFGGQGAGGVSEEHADAPPRKRSEWYRNPTVRIIDRWLPPATALIALLSIAGSTYSATSTENLPFWVFGTRMAVIVFSYVVIVAPLTFVGVRYSIKTMNAMLPKDGRWRAFAAYIWALMLAVLIWNAGGGGTPALIMGTTLGLALSAAALMLLFRFEPDEIGPASMYASLAFLFGAFLCGLAIWGANLGTMRMMTSGPGALTGSPYWSYMAWELPSQASPTTKPKPAQTTRPATPATQQAAPNTPPPEKVVTTLALGGSLETTIRPPGITDQLLVIRKAGNPNSVDVDLWDLEKNASKASATLPLVSSSGSGGAYRSFALTPDGSRVAHFSTFPRPGIYLQYLFENRSEFVADIPSDSVPHFLGFYSNTVLTYRIDKSAGPNGSIMTYVEQVDIAKQQVVMSHCLGVRLAEEGCNLALDSNGSHAAFVFRKQDGEHYIGAVNLRDAAAQMSDPSAQRSQVIGLDKRYDLAPLGLSFSPDNKVLTVHYEQNAAGAVYVLPFTNGVIGKSTFRSVPGSTLTQGDRRNLQGSTITWFPMGDAWLVNGDAIVDVTNGRTLTRLNITGVISQRFIAPDVVEVLIDSQGRRLQRVRINVPGLAGNGASGSK